MSWLNTSQPCLRCLSSQNATAEEGTHHRWPWSRTLCGWGDLRPSCTAPRRPGRGGCLSRGEKDRQDSFIKTTVLQHRQSEAKTSAYGEGMLLPETSLSAASWHTPPTAAPLKSRRTACSITMLWPRNGGSHVLTGTQVRFCLHRSLKMGWRMIKLFPSTRPTRSPQRYRAAQHGPCSVSGQALATPLPRCDRPLVCGGPQQPGQGWTLITLFRSPRGPCHLPPLTAALGTLWTPILSAKVSLHSPSSCHGQQPPG